MEDHELMDHAKRLMSNKQFEKALKPLFGINESSASKAILEAKGILISACYYNLENYPEALNWAKKASLANKSSEFASVSKCNAYRKMHQDANAFAEMKSFLDHNEGFVYMAVLKMFLDDVSSGVVTDPELAEKLQALAAKYGIK